jgi:putative FmdB family regulatory protein
MPRYDTRCTNCGREEELIVPMTAMLPACERCTGILEKVPATTAIAFKGRGWTGKSGAGRSE